MNWFKNCNTPDEIKSEYRRLAMKHHPDRGGDTATMQDINAAYHAALKGSDGRTYKSSESQQRSSGRAEYTYRYNQTAEEQLMNKLIEIIKALPATADITITVVGMWLWVRGDTRPQKETLKAAKFWWNRQREAWNWHPEGYASRFNKNVSIEEILEGGTEVPVENWKAAYAKTQSR